MAVSDPGNSARDGATGGATGGTRDHSSQASFDVSGVLLPRPFKVTKIGPAGLFVNDVKVSEAFYRDTLGFVTTEVIEWHGHRCVFMRHGNEHHSLKLLPVAARAELGLSAHTTCASMGLQVGSYQQLRSAVQWFTSQGSRFVEMPNELHPGIDYAAYLQDPEGHCLELHYYMEQVGWDGRPRPADQRRKIEKPWPASLEPLSDTYVDQVFQGPLG